MTKIYQKPLPTGKNVGFTLIELLVVVLIIGILAAVALPEYTKAVEKSHVADARTQLRNLMLAEKAYKLANSEYTDDLTALDIELTNISPDSPNTIISKDWVITVYLPTNTTNPFRAFAARAKNGVANTSGEYWYGISLLLYPSGEVKWKCQASFTNGGIPAMCKYFAGNATGEMN